MTLTLAFYVGRGNVGDRAIRMATRSPFSHVEMLAPYFNPRKRVMLAISASPRDGGVREKMIDFHPARWTFMELRPWYAAHAYDRALTQVGQGYDWTAIAFTFALALGRQSPNRRTCSELVAAALGFDCDAAATSPGSLYHQCSRLNAAYDMGLKGTL